MVALFYCSKCITLYFHAALIFIDSYEEVIKFGYLREYLEPWKPLRKSHE